MIEGMNGFGIEEYEYLKNKVGAAVEVLKELANLETKLPPEGL